MMLVRRVRRMDGKTRGKRTVRLWHEKRRSFSLINGPIFFSLFLSSCLISRSSILPNLRFFRITVCPYSRASPPLIFVCFFLVLTVSLYYTSPPGPGICLHDKTT